MAVRAMATMAFLLLALVSVPGAQAQESRCYKSCTQNYDACTAPCRFVPEPCDAQTRCQEAKDACTGICDRDCANIALPGAPPVLSCTTSCAEASDKCFSLCNADGGGDACPPACNGVKNDCTRVCQDRCAIVD